jgi:hypothetical protein
MTDAKTIEVLDIAFTSTVFPSPEDRARWEGLTPAERLAVIERDEEAGFRSGVARHASMHEILAEVRTETEE